MNINNEFNKNTIKSEYIKFKKQLPEGFILIKHTFSEPEFFLNEIKHCQRIPDYLCRYYLKLDKSSYNSTTYDRCLNKPSENFPEIRNFYNILVDIRKHIIEKNIKENYNINDDINYFSINETFGKKYIQNMPRNLNIPFHKDKFPNFYPKYICISYISQKGEGICKNQFIHTVTRKNKIKKENGKFVIIKEYDTNVKNEEEMSLKKPKILEVIQYSNKIIVIYNYLSYTITESIERKSNEIISLYIDNRKYDHNVDTELCENDERIVSISMMNN